MEDAVEISPIAGIRVMPVTKVHPVDPDLTIPFEVESAARTDDYTYSPAQKRASSAEEPDEEVEEIENVPEGQPAKSREEFPSPARINLFA